MSSVRWGKVRVKSVPAVSGLFSGTITALEFAVFNWTYANVDVFACMKWKI